METTNESCNNLKPIEFNYNSWYNKFYFWFYSTSVYNAPYKVKSVCKYTWGWVGIILLGLYWTPVQFNAWIINEAFSEKPKVKSLLRVL